MTFLVRILPNGPVWPYSFAKLRADEPRLSVGVDPHEGEIASWLTLDPPIVIKVPRPTTPPEHDENQFIPEEVTPLDVDGEWVQQWRLVPKLSPPAPSVGPNWPNIRGFYQGLISSNFYINKLAPLIFSPEPSWVGEPLSVVTVAITNLLIRVTIAPSPQQPEPSLQAALWGFLATASGQGAVTPEDLSEVQALMDAYGLTGVYTLTPPEN